MIEVTSIDSNKILHEAWNRWRQLNPELPQADLARRAEMSEGQLSRALGGAPLNFRNLGKVLKAMGFRVKVTLHHRRDP